MKRGGPLRRVTPLVAKTPIRRAAWKRSDSSNSGKPVDAGLRRVEMPKARKPIKQQSAAHAAEHRERMVLIRARAGHTGRVMCERCPTLGRSAEAVDTHERVNRSQAVGAAVDERLFVAVCRRCHDEIGASPAKAYAEGWLIKGSVWRLSEGSGA